MVYELNDPNDDLSGPFTGTGAAIADGYEGLRIAVDVQDVVLGGREGQLQHQAIFALAKLGLVEHSVHFLSRRADAHHRQLMDSNELRDFLYNGGHGCFSLHDLTTLTQKGFFQIHDQDDWRQACGPDPFDVILGRVKTLEQQVDSRISVEKYNQFIESVIDNPTQDVLKLCERLAQKDRPPRPPTASTAPPSA